MDTQSWTSQRKGAIPALLFSVLAILSWAVIVQAQSLMWAKSAGGRADDASFDIVVDASGSSYITGFFNGSATFGAGETNQTTLNSAGSLDVFVAKYDVEGRLRWVKPAGGDTLNSALGIARDVADNIYVTGYYLGTMTFGRGETNETTLNNAGSSDIFVARHNTNGMLLWAKMIGGSGFDIGQVVAVDVSHNSYVTGAFERSVTFGAGEANQITLNSAGSVDVFIAKYAIDGTLLWAKRAGSNSIDGGGSVAVDAFGNSYITGSFEGAATFGAGETNETTLNNSGAADIFMAKYNTDGALLWAKQAGGNSLIEGQSVAVDASGNSYVIGSFVGTATFAPREANATTLTSAASADVFVAKYNAEGLLLWVKQAGGSDNAQGRALALDVSGNSYITGFFEGIAIFGEGETNATTLTSAGSADIFVAEYDANGILLWAKRAGGNSFDNGLGIAVDASGNSYATGSFDGSAVFGPGETNQTILNGAGSEEIFILKYGPRAPTGVKETAIPLKDFKLAQNYPNPFSTKTRRAIDRPATTIVFETPKAVEVTLAIYDLKGQLIRTLVSGKVTSGRQQAIWEGADRHGREVASGIYIYRLDAGEFTATKKLILLQ